MQFDEKDYYKGKFKNDLYHGEGELSDGKMRFITIFDKGLPLS